MNTLALILIGLVAVEHLYIAYIEMFAWDSIGKRVFKKTMPQELFSQTKGLAANVGLYNGFLAVGLILSLLTTSSELAIYLRYLFLSFVIIAAVYGTFRSDKAIILKQGLPAILALTVSLLS